MGDLNENLSYRVPSRLCVGPTDLSLPFPHGGTALGIIHSLELRFITRYDEVKAFEYGGEVVVGVDCGFYGILGTLLKQCEDDALATIFPYTAIGVSGHRVVEHPGETEGKLASNRAITLLVSPYNPDHPGILLPQAIPLLELPATLKFAVIEQLAVPAFFRAQRGSGAGSAVKVGRLEDL